LARIRTIKPEFWSDERLSECSLSARLLFIGLISFADDDGRLDYSPARLRMQIFPCGSATATQLSEWFRELREHSLIRVYLVDSRDYLDIPGFTKHQRINRPTPSKIPPYSVSAHVPLTEPSVSPQGALIDGSGSGSGMDHGMDGKGSPSARRKTDTPGWLVEFKATYPKRAGDAGWPKAIRAGNARIAEGHTPEEFIEGARRYAAFIRGADKERTEFVKQAATFLGPDKPFLQTWDAPATKAEIRLVSNLTAGDEFMRRTENG